MNRVQVLSLVAGALPNDKRFLKTPYVGKHGWVSLIVDGKLDAKLLAGLVRQAYEQVALRRMLGELAEQES